MSASDIEALQNGEGMGLAKAAELNGYPGPRHVLDLAQELELTAHQREATEALYKSMHRKAVALGRSLVEAEAALDTLFRSGTEDSAALRRAVQTAGDIRGELRFVHLDAHLEQAEILTAGQIRRYARLRGYHGEHDERGIHH